MNSTPFIAVEGPIGVGKTSLAKAISEHYRFKLLKEIVEENPFLGKFYENIDEWSFQTEMFFLCNRYKQLEDIQKLYLNQNIPVVADYHIFKNRIFAERTLTGKNYEKYMQIFDILTEDMPVPNMIIYLNAGLETLLERIELRGRNIEKQMDPAYLMQLVSDYELFMTAFQKEHPEIPVLTFNGDNLDFVANSSDKERIFAEIETTLHKGELSR
ncbi:deoxyguanosine kinase [Fictibacillus enclensis]|uniref:Deoxyguanosine kinase n=1 Tax=Fictibacillus enclensis TaxID=1017270 RepID=A0A0V8IM01_9BACL|nr:deoxynucleoside kinase [Fictibacillus enclensis]KSU75796.1 deoxyguanosine kinase [Fictibacillus enclensis]SCC42708.1 deoxyguanosine kinase [Fictibacillus enclensis]